MMISLIVLFAVNGFTLYETTADEIANTTAENSVDSEIQALYFPPFINEDVWSTFARQ